jgi:hypothetical protein
MKVGRRLLIGSSFEVEGTSTYLPVAAQNYT